MNGVIILLWQRIGLQGIELRTEIMPKWAGHPNKQLLIRVQTWICWLGRYLILLGWNSFFVHNLKVDPIVKAKDIPNTLYNIIFAGHRDWKVSQHETRDEAPRADVRGDPVHPRGRPCRAHGRLQRFPHSQAYHWQNGENILLFPMNVPTSIYSSAEVSNIVITIFYTISFTNFWKDLSMVILLNI